MQGNEPSTYHVNKDRASSPRSTESFLITLERSQKLDLLIHLISNLRQSLVICGPNGIGKTTLLDELVLRQQDLWSMLTIQASSNLSLESIQDGLFQFLKQKDAEYISLELTSILSVLDKQNQKIVVIVDDAGRLIPGLMENLMHYAAAYECLRIVFSLTHDELHLKNSSDGAIDDCHFIEIPPLTEKQCGLFLQQLSGQPGAIVSFNAINDRMVEKLYRETHGIPGQIISELPKLSNYSAGGSNKWLSVFVISALIAIGVSVFISAESDKKIDIDETKTTLVLQKAEVVEISSPVIYPEINDDVSKPPIESSEEVKTVELVTIQPVIKKAENNSVLIDDTEKIDSEKDVRTQLELKEDALVQGKGMEKEAVKNIAENNSVLIDDTEKTNNEKDVRPLHELKEEILVQSGALEKETAEKIEKNSGETITEVTDSEKVTDSPIVKQKPVLIKEKKAEKTDKAEDAKQWVLAQPEKNYTIQLMVLSTRKSVLDFLKKNKSLKGDLKYFHTDKQGQNKYVLIYGSFKNSAIAAKKMKSLPIKYRKSWVRSFKILQKDINLE